MLIGSKKIVINPWTPRELFRNGENGFWLDGADRDTMFKDSAKAVRTTAAADQVEYWGDKSGNGNHFINAVDGSGGVCDAFGVKGQGSAGKYLKVDPLARAITSTGLHCIAVMRVDAFTGSNERYISAAGAAVTDFGSTDSAIILTRDVLNSNIQTYRNAVLSLKAISNSVSFLVEAVYDRTNLNIIVSENIGTPAGSTAAFNITRISIFDRVDVANTPSACTFSDLILRDSVFADFERCKCIRYLKKKWGV